MHKRVLLVCAVTLLAPLSALSARAVTIDWVTVGDAGNAADDTGYGSVAYSYLIGKYEVTNAQYAEFLNAVAATDTYALYNAYMNDIWSGIARSGSSGSYTYSVIAGRVDRPVMYVSFWDTLRFANWLHNGQPTGAQNNSTTEDGAYTITAEGIGDNSITRNAGATIFLTSEDEWYKAAYYDPVSSSYFDYPAGSNAETTCALPGATANTANCGGGLDVGATDVGAYTGSPSPNGTFDQGGNVWEWNEAITDLHRRGLRGGDHWSSPGNLAASFWKDAPVNGGGYLVGFRVAMIPEPGTGLLLTVGILGLAAWRRRSA